MNYILIFSSSYYHIINAKLSLTLMLRMLSLVSTSMNTVPYCSFPFSACYAELNTNYSKCDAELRAFGRNSLGVNQTGVAFRFNVA